MENGSSFLVTFAHEARATYCWCFQKFGCETSRKSTQYLQLLVQFHAFLVVSRSSQASTVLKTCSWSQIESCRTEIWGWNHPASKRAGFGLGRSVFRPLLNWGGPLWGVGWLAMSSMISGVKLKRFLDLCSYPVPTQCMVCNSRGKSWGTLPED